MLVAFKVPLLFKSRCLTCKTVSVHCLGSQRAVTVMKIRTQLWDLQSLAPNFLPGQSAEKWQGFCCISFGGFCQDYPGVEDARRINPEAKSAKTKVVQNKQSGENWVHANGGIINGVACVCAKWRVFVHFCAFLRFFLCVSVFFLLPRWAKKKTQIFAEFCKNVQKALLCNTPFS